MLSPWDVYSQVSESLVFEIPVDARSAGLGGRIIADLQGDLHAAVQNPTLLDSTAEGRIALGYVNYFAGMQLVTVNYGVRHQNKTSWQVGTRFLSYGSFEEMDAAGNSLGSFNGGDYLLQSGWAIALDSTWTVGLNTWAGMRTLDREVAAIWGGDVTIMGRWPEKYLAIGAGITGLGHQWGLEGAQPTGWLPHDIQIGITKGFEHAPFTLYLRTGHLESWDLAPPGTYDDTTDPLTGESISNSTFKLGDQFMRHTGIGTEIRLGPTLKIMAGFDYRRRKELNASGRTGTNGLALGIDFALEQFQIRLSRNTYHFAGSSTHLGIVFNPSQFRPVN